MSLLRQGTARFFKGAGRTTTTTLVTTTNVRHRASEVVSAVAVAPFYTSTTTTTTTAAAAAAAAATTTSTRRGGATLGLTTARQRSIWTSSPSSSFPAPSSLSTSLSRATTGTRKAITTTTKKTAAAASLPPSPLLIPVATVTTVTVTPTAQLARRVAQEAVRHGRLATSSSSSSSSRSVSTSCAKFGDTAAATVDSAAAAAAAADPREAQFSRMTDSQFVQYLETTSKDVEGDIAIREAIVASDKAPNKGVADEDILEMLAKDIALFRVLYGTHMPLPDNFADYITEADVEREQRYLFPTHARLTRPIPTVRKMAYQDLPMNHPARSTTARPASAAHFTGATVFYDLVDELESLFDALQVEAQTMVSQAQAQAQAAEPADADAAAVKEEEEEKKAEQEEGGGGSMNTSPAATPAHTAAGVTSAVFAGLAPPGETTWVKKEELEFILDTPLKR